jgi:hypothetical protein
MYSSWGHPESCPTDEALPLMGLISQTAAMFLYKTDSTLCSLEHAITMRGAEGRREDLHEMVTRLCAEAHRGGFKKCYVYVGSEQAMERAVATGFELSNEPQRWQLEREV